MKMFKSVSAYLGYIKTVLKYAVYRSGVDVCVGMLSATSVEAVPSKLSQYEALLTNTTSKARRVRVTLDIYPVDNPAHPLRHHGWYLVEVSLKPHSSSKFSISYDWSSNIQFRLEGKEVKLKERWSGLFSESGLYRLHLRMDDENNTLKSDLSITQRLLDPSMENPAVGERVSDFTRDWDSRVKPVQPPVSVPLAGSVAAKARMSVINAIKPTLEAATEIQKRQVLRISRLLERRIDDLQNDLSDVKSDLSGRLIGGRLEALGTHTGGTNLHVDWLAFQERFRGSQEEIRKKQLAYLGYFKGRENVVDIGCGRGEFLAILRDAGINAIGVDSDARMVEECRRKGLNVIKQDGVDYLRSLEDGSIEGIFSGQVVEHMYPSELIEFVNLAARKLGKDGVLVVETINPECLLVFANSFYMDLSHIRPVHPETLKFLLESAGFSDLKLSFFSPVAESNRLKALESGKTAGQNADFTKIVNENFMKLNEVLFSNQDYAVIARK